jgi:outer membrane protein assembly factor BamB
MRRQQVLSRIHMLLLVIAVALLGTTGAQSAQPPVASGGWPQWRGSDRSNASRETGLLKEWPKDGPLLWSASGIGDGIHSVSVAGEKLYTLGNLGGSEFVIALTAASGEKVWATRVGPTVEENSVMRWLTQRAPTVDGERVHILTVNGELVCLSATNGQALWRKIYVKEFGARRPVWGFCDHPFVDGERLICTPATTNAAVVAFNKTTGEIVWKTTLDHAFAAGYAATVVSEATGVRQYTAFFGFGLVGVGAADGTLLWSFDRPGTHIASTYTPIVDEDLICSPNGYGGGIVGVQLTREGNVFLVRPAYQRSMPLDPFQDSSARVGDRLYVVRRGRAVCIDPKSGTTIWEEEATPSSGRTALTYADGRLYLRPTTGTMRLVEVNPNRPIERGLFWIPGHEDSAGVTFPVVVGRRRSMILPSERIDAAVRPLASNRVWTIFALFVTMSKVVGARPTKSPRQASASRCKPVRSRCGTFDALACRSSASTWSR